jgi:hypothetical protein
MSTFYVAVLRVFTKFHLISFNTTKTLVNTCRNVIAHGLCKNSKEIFVGKPEGK